ncbi:hypothetical protein [Streptomyces halobius]|uniref:Secreted protein n=1 Tax=Streptomyces halobius TaxID=2879846 RepID=A0ABY4MFT1_9ACTN|nr:hypothetical protein [Streptomyces halobius]UQA95191.1 hypothetical protein K9S39_28035 [Streptomyces halobius]
MPRPTATQLVYGSATVFLSTLAMLLLSRTQTVIGVAVIALAGLGLGLLAALTFPARRTSRSSRVVRRHTVRAKSPAAPAALTAVPAPGGRLPRPRISRPTGAVEARVGEHSR